MVEYLSRIDGRNDEVRALWEICFPEDSSAYVDWVMAQKFAPERARGLVENGRLVSALHLLPLALSLRAKALAFPFVSGAGTLPEFRGGGRMNRLLDGLFSELHESGGSAVGLYPFSYGFYRASGFESMNRLCEGELPAALIERESARWLKPEGQMGAPEPSAMLEAFSAMAKRFPVHTIRDEAWCASRLSEWKSDGGSAVGYVRAGVAAGYALFSPGEEVLSTEELVYADEEALRALLAHLAFTAKLTGCRAVRATLPELDAPHELFSDSRDLFFQNPGAMLRIVDVEQFFSGMETGAKGAFCLQIDDGRCPWNDGQFLFDCEGGRLFVQKCGGRKPDGRMTVGALAQLASGAMDAQGAAMRGLIQSENKALFSAFPSGGGLILERY